MLSCKDITENANAYLEKDLPLSKRLSVRMHLFMCVHCRRYVDQLRITIQTLGLMKEEHPLDEEYTQQLLERFKQEIQCDQKHDYARPE
jgi:hypothetical protein